MASVQGPNREFIEPPRVPDRVYKEQDISLQFGDSFDQVIANDGYADDGEYSQPYRFLEHWYLIERGDGDTNEDKSTAASTAAYFKRRLPLPPNHLFSESYKNCIIAGWLQPLRSPSCLKQEQKQKQLPQGAIFVELTEMEYCSFDRSKEYRGYWIHTPEALYWLRQPDTATGTCTSTDIDPKQQQQQQLMSQEQVHFPSRSQLAVLSNVLDHVLLRPDAAKWAKTTVVQVHKEWNSAQHADTDNVQQPFNKVLLAKYKTFVGKHLVDPVSRIPFHPAYTPKSAFIKSLRTMSKSAAAVVTPAQLLAWTEESEAASQQYPWGESTVPVNPALSDSLEPTLSDISDDGDMTTISMKDGHLEQVVKESEEIINANKKGAYGSNGDSKMISIKLVVEGVPLPDLLKLSIANKYDSYHGIKNDTVDNGDYDVMKEELDDGGKNGTGDNNDHDVKDEPDGSGDIGDESYEEATTDKRVKKLSKTWSKASVTKKRASLHDAKKRPIKNAKVTKFEIPDGLWSPDRTDEALLGIGNYLDPPPQPSVSFISWESVQYHEFSIADEAKAKELLLDIGKWEIHLTSLERLLLVTESFGNSCRQKNDLVAKKLVSLAKCRYAIIIFDTWRRWAVFLLQERLDTKKPVQNTPELYLLISILNLITDCDVVKSAKNLDALKERGLNWGLGLQEIHSLCEKLQNHDLSSAYDRAKTRVELLRSNTTVGKPESSVLAAVPRKTASVPEASPSNSESSMLAKVPRKTARVPKKLLPSEQDEAAGTLASQMSDASPLSASAKADPGETARITSHVGRGRGRALPFWMAKNEIQEETGDHRQATKRSRSSALLSAQPGRPGFKESGSPSHSPHHANSMAGENDSTSLSCRQTTDKVARKETSLSGSLLTQRPPNREAAQARHTYPAARMARDEPKSKSDAWYSGDKRDKRPSPIEMDGRSLHRSSAKEKVSPEPRYSDDSQRASSERENRASYPLASRERENYSVYHSASGERESRPLYRSVRPAERMSRGTSERRPESCKTEIAPPNIL